MSLPPPVIYDVAKHAHLLPSVAGVHASCVVSPPYTIATFLPPINDQLMLDWWTARADEVSRGERVIFLQIASRKDSDGKEVEEVAGVVMLGTPFTQTGDFRGFVEKLLVRPEYRSKGIMRKLMELLEVVAREKGRKLLLLDTEAGSPAEGIYPKFGYKHWGTIPLYEVSPLDGSLKDGVFFYKDLR